MKKYYKFNLNLVIANVLSLVLLIIGMLFICLTMKDIKLYFENFDYVVFLLLMILYLAIHEIFHGIGFYIFCKDKKNVKYGAMLEKGVFYAMCQERISKKAIYISLLLPTIFLTFIALIPAYIFNIHILGLLAVFNLAGASGDLMMVYFLTKLPKDIEYIDYDNVIGFYIISKEDLSKIKSKILNYIECGKDTDSMINKKIKRIEITPISWVLLSIMIVGSILLLILK